MVLAPSNDRPRKRLRTNDPSSSASSASVAPAPDDIFDPAYIIDSYFSSEDSEADSEDSVPDVSPEPIAALKHVPVAAVDKGKGKGKAVDNWMGGLEPDVRMALRALRVADVDE